MLQIRLRCGVTLIETLIVIAVVGLLVQLLLPAVQAARESARRIQCHNNLRQLAIACQSHETAHQTFPTGGWGWNWTGDPDRGFKQQQPGGWVFNLLPFLELQAVRDLSRGTTGESRVEALQQMVGTPTNSIVCPSRRPARPLINGRRTVFILLETPPLMARGDYAANAGAEEEPPIQSGPESYKIAESWNDIDGPAPRWAASGLNGIVFQRSVVRAAQVTDGMAKTYLIGEKYIPSDNYSDGRFKGDNEHCYMGYDRDLVRAAHRTRLPLVDGPDDVAWHFGSSHSESFGMALCDGSVQAIAYDISPDVYDALGSRNGTETQQR